MDQTILVIEDNAVNLRLVATVLERAQFRVLQATNAVEALEIIDLDLPELIVTDVTLPGMDGLTLTRKLKADERTRQIPIVALTANAMDGDKHDALKAGCDGYISKPFDTRTLASQLAGFLRSTS
jgi:CheY-like chemotaxis protein